MAMRASIHCRAGLRCLVSVWVTAVLALSFGCESSPTDREIKAIDLSRVRKLVAAQEASPDSRTLLLIDARLSDDYARGHLPGARNVSAIPPDRRLDPVYKRHGTVVVYGENPGSPLARGLVKRLLELGIGHARFLPDGYDAWAAAGGRIERPASGRDSASSLATPGGARPGDAAR